MARKSINQFMVKSWGMLGGSSTVGCNIQQIQNITDLA